SLEFNGSNILFTVYANERIYLSGNWEFSASGPVALGQWCHVAGVYDGSHLSCYINGQLVGPPVDTYPYGTGIFASSNPLWIGSDPSNTNRLFDGLIDDVQLYNRALSAG